MIITYIKQWETYIPITICEQVMSIMGERCAVTMSTEHVYKGYNAWHTNSLCDNLCQLVLGILEG